MLQHRREALADDELEHQGIDASFLDEGANTLLEANVGMREARAKAASKAKDRGFQRPPSTTASASARPRVTQSALSAHARCMPQHFATSSAQSQSSLKAPFMRCNRQCNTCGEQCGLMWDKVMHQHENWQGVLSLQGMRAVTDT